ncbi:MAG: hypothetical protein AB7H77_01625, partial [Bdellovibrionales bacterium]
MINRFAIYSLAFVALLLSPVPPHAQESSNGTLHVLRPSINAEQETAELCLEFDHPLDLSERHRTASAIRLRSDGKTVPITLNNLSVSGTLLCLQSLIHRQEYSLTLNDVRGAGGEKLNDPYKLSFTVPNRSPSLSFAGDPVAAGLARYRNNEPVLRAINVGEVKMELYRLTDPARMAEAYRQRMQTTLAPTESLTFAKENGKLIWQSTLKLSLKQDEGFFNRSLEHSVPLKQGAGALSPGLYFIAAADTAPRQKSKPRAKLSSDSESRVAKTDLAPLAAQWFIVSDLKVRVLGKTGGFYAETEDAYAPGVVGNVRLVLFDHDQKQLAETRSDASGVGLLSLASDRRASAASILAMTDAGDIDFADLATEDGIEPESRFTLSNLQAGVMADRSFYFPGAPVYLTLTARNIHDEVVATPGSAIQILRPDRSVYATLPVPDGKAGVSFLSLPAPTANGIWPFVWQRSDGSLIARTTLRVSSNPEAPHVEVNADRPVLDSGGDVNLTLRSRTEAGQPAAYAKGQILVQWAELDQAAGWNDYHFSNGQRTDAPPAPVASFMTDASGAAYLRLKLKPPEGLAPLHTAILSVRSDPAMGMADPQPLTLPMRTNDLVIGIKPLATDGKFAENSVARFDIVALGGDGRRRGADGLKYQIYEEGRSFEWYQAEGRWDYKPLPQRRRLGGGALDVRASGSNIVRWRVTAGSYTLEISDAGGDMLARYSFDAGWGLLKPSRMRPDELALRTADSTIQQGASVKIRFNLRNPATINAVVADDQIRKIIHELRPAGDNEIVFTPDENWGERLRVTVEAHEMAEGGMNLVEGHAEVSVRHKRKELSLALQPADNVASGKEAALTVTVGNIAGQQPSYVSAVVTPVPSRADETLPPAGALVPNIDVGANGRAVLRFAVPENSKEMRLYLIASNATQWGKKSVVLPVYASFDAGLSLPPLMKTGDVVNTSLVLQNNSTTTDVYHYALEGGAGVKLLGTTDGKISIPPNRKKRVYLGVQPFEVGAKEIKLDVVGARDFRMNRSWPVNVAAEGWIYNVIASDHVDPQNNRIWPDKNSKKKNPAAETIFVSGAPLFDAPRLIGALLEAEPFTTGEIVAWLESVYVWREVIARGGYLPESTLKARERDMRRRLLARQKSDGSFPVLPDGTGDVSSTADALLALAHAEGSLAFAKPAADAASGWLRQKLSNTWFDEAERPARAAGFAALAVTNRLDIAALRYFSETSADKSLPPQAVAQLAAAFAKIGDPDKNGMWLAKIRDQMPVSSAAFPLLAGNPLFNPQDLLSALQKTSSELVRRSSHDPEALGAFLRATAIVNARTGNWRAKINETDMSRDGIYIAGLSVKTTAFTIRNLMDRALFVSTVEKIR